MPKPFPFPLNVGTDICHRLRILDILKERRIARRFIQRILTEEERAENKERIEGPLGRWERTIHIKYELLAKARNGFLEEGKSGDVLKSGRKGEEIFIVGDDGVKAQRVTSKDIWKNASDNNLREQQKVSKEMGELASFMAGRFAAKEAAMKAHHSRRLTYHDMVIRRPPDTEEGSQAPVAIILPRGKSGEQGWEEGQECKISISHDGDYATATCLAYEPAAGAADEISAGGKTG